MQQLHKIGKYEVKLKEKLGWYDLQLIKNEIISGAKLDNNGLTGFDGDAMLKMKIKTWELAIEEIKEGDKVIPFSLDWVKQLTEEEGAKLDTEIEKLDSKK